MKTIKNCGIKDYTTIHFDWFFTDWCNYSCTYCCAAHDMVDTFSKKTSPSLYKLALAKLKQIKQPFHIELLGGEPTLHPNIEDVVEQLNGIEQCKEVEIITNLSRSVNFYSQFNDPKYTKLKILASYHPEYFSKQFAEKCIELSKMEHFRFMVNVNMSDKREDWENTLWLFDTLEREGVKYGFNFLHSTPSWIPDYTPEFFEFFNDKFKQKEFIEIPHEFTDGTHELITESEIVKRKLNLFKNEYRCNSMYYQIRMDGTIVNQCTEEKVPVTMTNLGKKVVCPLNECPCDVMFKFPKEKI